MHLERRRLPRVFAPRLLKRVILGVECPIEWEWATFDSCFAPPCMERTKIVLQFRIKPNSHTKAVSIHELHAAYNLIMSSSYLQTYRSCCSPRFTWIRTTHHEFHQASCPLINKIPSFYSQHCCSCRILLWSSSFLQIRIRSYKITCACCNPGTAYNNIP
jgi:hypothetical protein